MSDVNGGQLIARQLKAAGIDTVFAVVAGPMLQALTGAVEEGIKVVNCRHEESAAFMASAWGYVNRQPGVVIVGSGPGMTNTVTSLYVATESAMPLVVLGGSNDARQRGLGSFQEADQVAFARPGSKWVSAVASTERIPGAVHLALGKSISGRPGGVYLDFPGELISNRVPEETAPLRMSEPTVSRPHPDPAGVATIADMLCNAERPLILIGKGAAWADAGPALTRLVDRGIPFLASPMGRGTVPDDHGLCMGAARSTAMAGADVVLMVGARFNWTFQFGDRLADDARIAHIDIEAEEMYSAANVELGLVADCAIAVEQINEAIEGRTLKTAGTNWASTLQEQCLKNQASITEQMDSDQVPINHYRLLRDVRDCLSRDATVTEDGEFTMGVTRQVMPSYLARHRLGAGTTGCMGTGLPYAIGAKLARPDQQVVAVLGDYAFGAAAMEVETCARMGVHVVIVVSNNAGIAAHTIQDNMFPPDSPPVATLIPARYEQMVEMVGGHAERVVHPDDLRPAIERALAADTVALVNVETDPKAQRRGAGYLG